VSLLTISVGDDPTATPDDLAS